MPEPISSIRRQVYELSLKDLNDFPIWEFCSDEEDREGQDEATVRPCTETEVNGGLPGAHIVAADVTFGDGSSALGYLYTGDPQDSACVQPNLCLESSQVNFWMGWLRFIPDVDKRIAKSYELIGKERNLIFPITFNSRVKIDGAPLKVTVGGFMALDENRQLKIVG